MARDRSNLVPEKRADKHGVERTVYVRPDAGESDRRERKASVGKSIAKPKKKPKASFEEEIEESEDQAKDAVTSEEALLAQIRENVPKYTPQPATPAFRADPEWGAQNLSRDNLTNVRKSLRLSESDVDLIAENHGLKSEALRERIDDISSRWERLTSATDDTGFEDLSEKERIRYSRTLEDIRTDEDSVSVIARRHDAEPEDVEGSLRLASETISGGRDRAMHVKTYAVHQRRAILMDQIAEIQEKSSREEEFLRSLNPGGTEGKFAYSLQPDEKVAISFTPGRAFDESRTSEFLTPSELEQATVTRTYVDSKIVEKILEEDPDRWEAMRNQRAERVSFIR